MNDKDFEYMDRILTILEIASENFINLNNRVTRLEIELEKQKELNKRCLVKD